MKKISENLRYLQLLAKEFPNVPKVTTEIINLEAILQLPKATEHFLADLHGENEAFQHVLRNASGNIKRKVQEIFDKYLSEQEIKELCTLIYYPEEKLELVRQANKEMNDFYQTTLNRLIMVCRNVSSKYTRSKVRKAMPEDYAYVIEELITENGDTGNVAHGAHCNNTVLFADQLQNGICHGQSRTGLLQDGTDDGAAQDDDADAGHDAAEAILDLIDDLRGCQAGVGINDAPEQANNHGDQKQNNERVHLQLGDCQDHQNDCNDDRCE